MCKAPDGRGEERRASYAKVSFGGGEEGVGILTLRLRSGLRWVEGNHLRLALNDTKARNAERDLEARAKEHAGIILSLLFRRGSASSAIYVSLVWATADLALPDSGYSVG